MNTLLVVASKILWSIAAIAALVAAWSGLTDILAAKSAPQQAAGAAIAVAIAVIPYCFTRACEKLLRK